MKTAGVYVIRNQVNGKVYVGRSRHIEGRWREHRSALAKGAHDNKHLQRSWDKHGEANFVFEVLEATSEVSGLVLLESAYILKLSADDKRFGYNQTTADIGGHVRLTAATRQKMSEAHKGVPKSEEHKAKIQAANAGVPKSAAAIASLKTAWVGRSRVLRDETRQKLSEAGSKGGKYLRSDETKAKVGECSRARFATPEGRAKAQEAHAHRKGVPLSAETREKMSQALTGRKLTPEHIANAAAARRGTACSPETRAKIAATKRAKKMQAEGSIGGPCP